MSADIVSLTRLVTSRSHEKQKEDSRLISKQSVKLGELDALIEKQAQFGRRVTQKNK